MHMHRALQSAVRYLQPNPAPDLHTINQLQQCRAVVLCLRQKTYRRFRTCMHQLESQGIPIAVSTEAGDMLREIDKVPKTDAPLLTCVEPTIIRRPFTALELVSNLRTNIANVLPTLFIHPNLSHAFTMKSGRRIPSFNGYAELQEAIERQHLHAIDISRMKPIDMIEASVRHHFPHAEADTVLSKGK